jgi:hypothetical protein
LLDRGEEGIDVQMQDQRAHRSAPFDGARGRWGGG